MDDFTFLYVDYSLPLVSDHRVMVTMMMADGWYMQALNQLFEKIMALDVDERHLLRMGHGEEELETEKDYSRFICDVYDIVCIKSDVSLHVWLTAAIREKFTLGDLA